MLDTLRETSRPARSAKSRVRAAPIPEVGLAALLRTSGNAAALTYYSVADAVGSFIEGLSFISTSDSAHLLPGYLRPER